MRKIIALYIMLTILASCTTQKQFDGFRQSELIKEITFSEYVPIYSSFSPRVIKQISIKKEIYEIVMIFNRAHETDHVIKTVFGLGESDTFNYQIRFSNGTDTETQMYVIVDRGDIFVTTISLYDHDKQEFELYQIQETDSTYLRNLLH